MSKGRPATHFQLPVTKQMVKKDLKALMANKLVEEGLLTLPDLPCSPVSPDRPADEQLKPAVLTGDGDLPAAGIHLHVAGSPDKVGKTTTSPFSDTPSLTDGFKKEALVKVHLARLQLEAQDKAHARQAEFELRRMELEAETKKALKLRKLELHVEMEKEIGLRQLGLEAIGSSTVTKAGAEISNIFSPVPTKESDSSSSFNVSKNIVLVPPF